MGTLIYENNNIDVWKTPEKNGKGGWIGIFHRSKESKSISLKPTDLKISTGRSDNINDIWKNSLIIQFKD